MDWFSRDVLAWELSILLDKEFCLTALDRALGISRPEIFNSDQGGQYTSPDFTGRLEAKGIRISMDGRGQVFDNVFIERLWQSVKYEEVNLPAYETVDEARRRLASYFICYNTERLHSSLGYQTPREFYFSGSANALAEAESLILIERRSSFLGHPGAMFFRMTLKKRSSRALDA